jgi:hypothetical protein
VVAGRLELEMVANLARLSTDLRQSTSMLEGWGRDANRIIGGVQSAFAALGLGIGVVGFSALIKGATDAMDRLNDLSKVTKIAVEDLAGLGVAAKKSGSDLEGTATAINKLSQNMGKDAEKFRALGVTAKEPLEAFKQLADIYVALEDPQQRAAVMAEALGKSWATAAPLLAEGGKRIGEMVESGSKAAGVTKEMAARADELNDKWIDIVGSGGLVNKMVGDLTPLLIKLADEFLRNREEAQKLGAGFSPLLEIGKALTVFFGEVIFVFKMVGHEIGMLAAQFETLLVARDAFLRGDFQGAALALLQFKDIGAEGNRVAVEARRVHDEWVNSIMRLGTASATAGGQLATLQAAQAGAFGDQASRRAASEAAAAARAFLTKTVASTKELGKVKQDMALHDAHVVAMLKEQERITAHLLAMNKEEMDAAEARGKALEELSNEWAEGTEALELELRLIGASNIERRKAILIEKARLDAIAAGNNAMAQRDIAKNLQDQLDLLDKIGAKVGDTKALQEQASAWNDLGDIVGRFFSDLVMDGKSAFDNLKRMVKSLLAEMIGLFARRWILNLAAGAGVPGAAGALSAMGGNTGLLGLIGSGASAMFGGMGAFGVAATSGFSAGAATLGVAATGGAAAVGGLGAVAGAAMAVVPVIGLVVAGLYALYTALQGADKWRASLGFGANAQVYATDGVFGREGFSSIEGDDAVNRTIQQFMASTGALDRVIAATLTSAQIASITAALATYNRRTDGQPAEFAFDRDEEGAAQQLTLEYLKAKYGTVFDAIDGTFATFIRDYTGSAEDLLREIGTFATMLQQIAAMGIPGFDITALRAMQREGEQIGDTFQRVAGGWAQFIDLFTTDAERLTMAQDLINTTFARFGQDVPANAAEFEALVRQMAAGLATATEEEREFFQALLELAPAFRAISDVAEETIEATRRSVQSIRDLINDINGASSFDSAVGAFQAANPWARAYDAIGLFGQLLTATDEDLARYSDANRALITTILNLGRNADDAAEGISRLGNSAWGVFDPRPRPGDPGNGDGLGAWLDSMLVGPNSPLAPDEQMAEAERQFRAAIAGGDPNAIRTTGQAWIDIARELHRSGSGFDDVFQTVFDMTAAFAGVPDFNSRMLSIGEQQNSKLGMIVSATQETNTLIQKMMEKADDNADLIASKIKAPEPVLGKR